MDTDGRVAYEGFAICASVDVSPEEASCGSATSGDARTQHSRSGSVARPKAPLR